MAQSARISAGAVLGSESRNDEEARPVSLAQDTAATKPNATTDLVVTGSLCDPVSDHLLLREI